MKMRNAFYMLIFASVFVSSGCIVRTYTMTKDRIDQDLTAGNRGYIMGKPPLGAETKQRKPVRTTRVVEIELHSPIKFEKKSAHRQAVEEQEILGNRGYITETKKEPVVETETASLNAQQAFQKYTVEKGDTLQKISQKLYGTTKKWSKLYEANKDVLKAPNKIYPGQVLNVPVYQKQAQAKGSLKETKENLK